MRIGLLLALLGGALTGCTAGTEATVSASDEAKFKNPPPFDASKIPANAMNRPGPRFIGEPSGASNPSAPKPPTTAPGG